MFKEVYSQLVALSLKGDSFPPESCYDILMKNRLKLLPLLLAARKVKEHEFGNKINIHKINNVQNGHCSEDCHYCAQSKNSRSIINSYSLKEDEEIIKNAAIADKNGASYYSLVLSGKRMSDIKVDKITNLISKLKKEFSIKICLSPGLMNENNLLKLKAARLDSFHHNLNTSKRFYLNICSTHSFEDRLLTLQTAQKVGLSVCTGIIAGMGESIEDLINMAALFKSLKIKKIAINFLIPIKGNILDKAQNLTPGFCLRILCLFRFLNPVADIIVGAGREIHFKRLEEMTLYPASSLFTDNYLNIKSANLKDIEKMILKHGFKI